ncbi:hypothetical protein [Streptomyces acidiscabies]|uniref:Uncharacterized protein n=1 Tax=Streptomyces acidiscabies TaxID=42234 RepID=A0AAP6BKK3_9ACTN|nr:hypothetical protein [Streptomyces acidiscabies]MBP5942148.1 hypothetical protein [Streptomyces sp. LBUM 1476]MBZ3913662.1 hypothetical protein [Streptomyces acidiscabies]MDX2966494.1 hypothetical protein [Streptomyces acidiscabies]MDX3025865.1 hypothetical protein [Streptomyces acidiscabies]MDX3796447.1 hypothetical protein [Streptomyces acidiscabies]
MTASRCGTLPVDTSVAVIDQLVCYSPLALQEAGGTAQMEAQIAHGWSVRRRSRSPRRTTRSPAPPSRRSRSRTTATPTTSPLCRRAVHRGEPLGVALNQGKPSGAVFNTTGPVVAAYNAPDTLCSVAATVTTPRPGMSSPTACSTGSRTAAGSARTAVEMHADHTLTAVFKRPRPPCARPAPNSSRIGSHGIRSAAQRDRYLKKCAESRTLGTPRQAPGSAGSPPDGCRTRGVRCPGRTAPLVIT